ncbi:hypothetical protein, partial [Salmonella enterica]|uniref:hypothetical protein n=1 Tax=Salmonella enterica TaxID=28901 RepID=UPI002A74978A
RSIRVEFFATSPFDDRLRAKLDSAQSDPGGMHLFMRRSIRVEFFATSPFDDRLRAKLDSAQSDPGGMHL